MGIGKRRLSCNEAKQMDLVGYLASLGFSPSKIKGKDHWYLSPLRDERTPSFKVNQKENVWFDHGSGRGGNLIDFGILFHQCSVKELLQRLETGFSFHQPVILKRLPENESQSTIKVVSAGALSSLSLLRYLKQRRIDETVARKYCQEVLVELNEKRFSAIGFRSNKGGFELRNPSFKGSTSPKSVTMVENDFQKLSVFEGFFDFLSLQTIQRNAATDSSFLILNSTAFFEKSRPLMKSYAKIHLYLDNDKTGQNLTQKALSWGDNYINESGLYKGYKDLNEWMQQIGKSQKQGLRLR